MSKTDPGWIYILVILGIIGLLWKPMIMPAYNKIAHNFSKEDQIAAGKAIFFDEKRWGNQGVSCATCHIEGQKPPTTKATKLIDLKFVSLSGVYYKYTKGAMGNDQELANRINRCVSTGARLGSPPLAPASDTIKNLMFYIQSIK